MTAAKLMKCELILNLFVNTEEVNTKIYQEILQFSFEIPILKCTT